jgi:hypothetical protein
MKPRKPAAWAILIITLLSCNLPLAVNPPSAENPAGGTPTIDLSQAAPQSTFSALPMATPLALLPADLPFYIDCSAIDPARQADCEAYLTITRDQAYPILRELTGVSLADCYDGVYFTILPDNPQAGAVGIADQNHIQYSVAASLDDIPPYDTHELLHTVSMCSGALDYHIFHGSFDAQAKYLVSGYEFPGARESAMDLRTYEIEEVKGIAEPGLRTAPCLGILGNTVTVIYYDLGITAIQPLYRATIDFDPALQPSPQLYELVGPQGNKIQALVNAIKQLYPDYAPDAPACGY